MLSTGAYSLDHSDVYTFPHLIHWESLLKHWQFDPFSPYVLRASHIITLIARDEALDCVYKVAIVMLLNISDTTE